MSFRGESGWAGLAEAGRWYRLISYFKVSSNRWFSNKGAIQNGNHFVANNQISRDSIDKNACVMENKKLQNSKRGIKEETIPVGADNVLQ